jgi:beta-1,4-mannosyltransferase
MKSTSKEGVTPVRGKNTPFFPIVRSVISERDIDVIHLIWTDPFYITGGESNSDVINGVAKIISGIRALVFVTELLLIKLLGASIVWTVHNKHNHERNHIRLDRTVNRFVARLADEMTVECEAAKDIIIDLFQIKTPSKIHVVEEGNYIGAYPNEMTRTEARERLMIDEDTFLFTYFGQIRPYKNVPRLIDSFSNLEVDDSTLLVVGSPYTEEMKIELQRQADDVDNISFVFEFISNEEIQMYMNAADIVALPYRDIMTSGSVLLAMSFGRAVVAPRMGCIPALVDEKGGFLYDSDDPHGLEEALKTAYETGDRVREMGEHNYRVAGELSWAQISERTVEIYRRA